MKSYPHKYSYIHTHKNNESNQHCNKVIKKNIITGANALIECTLEQKLSSK